MNEVKNTRGRRAVNYGINQPIATSQDCSWFFKFLLHEKLQGVVISGTESTVVWFKYGPTTRVAHAIAYGSTVISQFRSH